MKLLDILTEEIIVQPTGTGRNRMFNVIDTDTGNVLSQHNIRGTADRAAERVRSATPTATPTTSSEAPRPAATAARASEVRVNRAMGETLQVVDTGQPRGRYVVLDDTYRARFVFDDADAAQRFANSAKTGIANGSITSIDELRTMSRQAGGQYRPRWTPNSSAARNINSLDDLDRFANNNNLSKISRWLTSGGPVKMFALRAVTAMAAAGGLAFSAYGSIIANIEEYEQAVREDPDLLEEYGSVEEYSRVAFGQLFAMFGVALAVAYRTPQTVFRIVRRASNAVALAATVGSGGAGAIPAIIGIVIREGSFFLISMALTSQTVQDALTRWLMGTTFGDLIGLFGDFVQTTAAALDEATNGLVGSQNLRRSLGFEQGDPTAAVQGEYVSSSEWAKLVFGPMLFPPAMERQMVPYISPARREELLSEALDIEASLIDEVEGQSEGSAPAEPATPTSSAPETERSPAAQSADPDGDGNADDPEAQVFTDPSVASRPAPREPGINSINSISDLGPMP